MIVINFQQTANNCFELINSQRVFLNRKQASLRPEALLSVLVVFRLPSAQFFSFSFEFRTKFAISLVGFLLPIHRFSCKDTEFMQNYHLLQNFRKNTFSYRSQIAENSCIGLGLRRIKMQFLKVLSCLEVSKSTDFSNWLSCFLFFKSHSSKSILDQCCNKQLTNCVTNFLLL